MMEYMAAGKPVVSTNAGGFPELVESGRTWVPTAPRLTPCVIGQEDDQGRDTS